LFYEAVVESADTLL